MEGIGGVRRAETGEETGWTWIGRGSGERREGEKERWEIKWGREAESEKGKMEKRREGEIEKERKGEKGKRRKGEYEKMREAVKEIGKKETRRK